MTPPLRVSAVMTVFNGATHVASAVQSILTQTFRDFELLVVDDGSTDRTLEILHGIDDPRIRVVASSHIGFIAARELGIREAKGTWIAWMDSDDLCDPERLARQLAFLDAHPECLFVGTIYSILTPHGRSLQPRDTFDWRYLEAADITLARVMFADPSAIFARATALEVGLYDKDFNNEKPLWYKLLRRGRGAVLGSPLYWYRYSLNSLSHPDDEARTAALEETNAAVRARYDPATPMPERRSARDKDRERTRSAAKGVDYYLLAGDYAAATATALSAWKRHPSSPRAAKLLLMAALKRRSLRRFWAPDPADPRFEPAELGQHTP